ncbi:MAG: prolipoprotein diacylglyceryl transferase [Planctomycetota bacterium]
MHPELITLPGGFSIKTYGFFMMVGFLSGVWMAMRRAERVKADPDVVLDVSLICLIFGVGGARIFYVIHYWKSQFADAANPLLAIIDITAGGLEFLGGFIGAIIATALYAAWKKHSLRLYLDILAPSTMWGLALGRVGCFFNGCCFGAICTTGAAHQAALPWAISFPYGSPAHLRHWEDRKVTIPAELLSTSRVAIRPWIVPDTQLNMPIEKREGLIRRIKELDQAHKSAKTADANSTETERLKRELDAVQKQANTEFGSLQAAQRFPSRVNPQRATSVSELEQLAAKCQSLPVQPAQLYAAVGALLIALVLSAVFYRRKRHGVVIGWLLLLYAIQRTLEEIIRADNPHDIAGLTVSQSISLGLFLFGVVYLIVLYKTMPERSPFAVVAPSDPQP